MRNREQHLCGILIIHNNIIVIFKVQTYIILTYDFQHLKLLKFHLRDQEDW